MSIFDRVRDLYHFTDDRNLTSIRQHNGLLSWSELNRLGIAVPAPGGNDWSHEADQRLNFDQYVHLCFRQSHRMEWSARQDGRIVTTAWLQIDVAILKAAGVLFTPDTSNKSGVESMPIADAEPHIDFDILYTKVQSDDWQQRLVQAEKCEVLVPRHVPLGLIRNI